MTRAIQPLPPARAPLAAATGAGVIGEAGGGSLAPSCRSAAPEAEVLTGREAPLAGARRPPEPWADPEPRSRRRGGACRARRRDPDAEDRRGGLRRSLKTRTLRQPSRCARWEWGSGTPCRRESPDRHGLLVAAPSCAPPRRDKQQERGGGRDRAHRRTVPKLSGHRPNCAAGWAASSDSAGSPGSRACASSIERPRRAKVSQSHLEVAEQRPRDEALPILARRRQQRRPGRGGLIEARLPRRLDVVGVQVGAVQPERPARRRGSRSPGCARAPTWRCRGSAGRGRSAAGWLRRWRAGRRAPAVPASSGRRRGARAARDPAGRDRRRRGDQDPGGAKPDRGDAGQQVHPVPARVDEPHHERADGGHHQAARRGRSRARRRSRRAPRPMPDERERQQPEPDQAELGSDLELQRVRVLDRLLGPAVAVVRLANSCRPRRPPSDGPGTRARRPASSRSGCPRRRRAGSARPTRRTRDRTGARTHATGCGACARSRGRGRAAASDRDGEHEHGEHGGAPGQHGRRARPRRSSAARRRRATPHTRPASAAPSEDDDGGAMGHATRTTAGLPARVDVQHRSPPRARAPPADHGQRQHPPAAAGNDHERDDQRDEASRPPPRAIVTGAPGRPSPPSPRHPVRRARLAPLGQRQAEPAPHREHAALAVDVAQRGVEPPGEEHDAPDRCRASARARSAPTTAIPTPMAASRTPACLAPPSQHDRPAAAARRRRASGCRRPWPIRLDAAQLVEISDHRPEAGHARSRARATGSGHPLAAARPPPRPRATTRTRPSGTHTPVP